MVAEYRCPNLVAKRPQDGLFSRQRLIPGFSQEALSSRAIALAGAGGIGGEIGEGLVRKGVGELGVYDFDAVALSNLNRQFFGRRDIGRNKALRFARNLSKAGFGGTRIYGCGMSFQDALELGLFRRPHALCVGLDNEAGRIDGSEYGLREGIPVVFVAVSRDGDNGMVFVQEPGKACYGCAFPDRVSGRGREGRNPCAPDPAVKDILKVVAGIALYAFDSLFMERKRNWNLREVFLAGFVGERIVTVDRREDCPLCGHRANG
jgi:molybdopterin/thiamine biosynthesis adenylyltransferase